jgi:hypothetical protein
MSWSHFKQKQVPVDTFLMVKINYKKKVSIFISTGIDYWDIHAYLLPSLHKIVKLCLYFYFYFYFYFYTKDEGRTFAEIAEINFFRSWKNMLKFSWVEATYCDHAL